MPLHFSKYSNRIYSNFKHLFLLVYKQFRKFTYEELLTDLEDNLDYAKHKICKTQKIEVALRVIDYNMDRLIRLGNDLILIFIKIKRVSY